ncbi:MAG: RagB/SusD family nutrient uptake outer membrane protein [Tenuifilaceae bacterium]|jgi:hypothetical protein|nr:RagB/SusD family nutrient uptake outer membrane protein [Tenuifilaceae bacterium]
MKKLIIALASTVFLLFSCSEEMLETTPSSSVSGVEILKNTTNARVALNGVYRALYLPNSDWFGTVFNVQQNFGIVSHNLVGDLMGEDFVQAEIGSGWFWFDYIYDVHRRYASDGWRIYGIWNFYYKVISNVNYIIAAETTMEGAEAEVKSIVGEALALRAYAHYYLSLFFQQTYVGHETAPGIPVYTEPSTSSSEGKPRGTMQEVYTQVLADLERAATLIDKNAAAPHKSNVDYYVVKAIQAKVFLTMERFEEAAAAANEARTKPGLALTTTAQLDDGFNDISLPSVMWGGQVIATEAVSGGWGTLFNHMDPGSTPAVITANGYGVRSRKCIDASLYNRISDTDARKAVWWRGVVTPEATSGPNKSYVQLKYKYKNVADFTGDYIYLRAEEMLLIEAEALCRQAAPNYAGARALLLELGAVRDPNYPAILATRTDANTYSNDTKAAPVTLLEEVLFQRRIELWGEAGRLFDLKRLGLGFTRNYVGTNHSAAGQILSVDTSPLSKMFALPLPQQEFDGNPNIDETDQNPM